MAKVTRIQHVFDQELAEKGLKRIYRMEMTEKGQPVYREQIIEISEDQTPAKPWWKVDTKKKKAKK
jgi:hypothetical protein